MATPFDDLFGAPDQSPTAAPPPPAGAQDPLQMLLSLLGMGQAQAQGAQPPVPSVGMAGAPTGDVQQNPFAPMGVDPAGAPAAPRGGGSSNFFDPRTGLPPAPRTGGLPGFFDWLQGRPTPQQVEIGAAEHARQQTLGRTDDSRRAATNVIQRAAALRSENPTTPPQALLSQLMLDPVFAQNAPFLEPDVQSKIINDFLSATQPAPPVVGNIPQGGAQVARDPHTQQVIPELGAAQPTGTVQEEDFLLRQARTPEERERILEMILQRRRTAAGVRAPTAQEAALDRLVTQGVMTALERDYVVGHLYSNAPIYDDTGRVVGTEPMDILRAIRSGRLGPPRRGPGTQGPGTQGPAPVGPDGAPAPQQTFDDQGRRTDIPWTPDRARVLERRVDMFDAAGAAGVVNAFGGRIGGMFDSRQAQERTNAARDGLALIVAEAQRLKESREFRSEADARQLTFPSMGVFTNPLEAINTTISLRTWLEEGVQHADRILAAPQQGPGSRTRQEREFAVNARARYESVLRTIGMTTEELMAKRAEVRQNQGGGGLDPFMDMFPRSRAQAEEGVRRLVDPRARSPGQQPPAGPNPYQGMSLSQLQAAARQQGLTADQRALILQEVQRQRRGAQ